MEQSKQNIASLTNEAAASSSSSSLPLSSTDQNHYTYEVFLSFRGEDTRYDFTDHLDNALCLRGIKTFRDDKLSRGEDISQELLKAIDESRVSIVVFSQNYASSRWCLDELVKILDCRKSKGQKFRAVFYKVVPSDVRHQTGAFGDAFAKIDRCKYKDSIGKWREALEEAADLSGWTFKEGRYETEFINDIVGELSTRVVNPSCEWHVAEHPIGLESCRQDVVSLLKTEENIVRMVGIWGPGGIGKTTIAKAVFNSICHKFETSCFLADVRSNSNDLAQLQERLLHDVLRDSNLEVSSVDQGVSFIKKRMQDKKVLLILDDVSHSSQLKNLVPSPDCFGPGSRILITTRDKRWLIAHEVNEVYEVKMLDDRHALELFSLHAFKRNEPPSDYLELAQHVIRYAQGLPLALIVLGSHLFRRSTEEWEATIGSCKGGPQADIHKVLKLSYDALGRDLKELFLDIACFFKGEDADHVKPILEACYDHKTMVIGIAQLQEKALIRIDKDDEIWMHDLIEEMGKDIVYQESPDEPGERSRVWSEEDVDYVLTNNTGTNKVIGIKAPWPSTIFCLNAKSFSEMKNLRYICMGETSLSGDIDYLSNQLRWLDWESCPLQCFPSDFQANKLVELNISFGEIRRLWEGRKNFSRLTCMDLSYCESLEELPDLSGIPNLKVLNLISCESLKELPDLSGIPNLEKLDLSYCLSLKELPDLSGIPDLKKLNLHGCRYLKELPDLSGIPNFFSKLEELNLSRCESLKELPDLSGIPNLKELDLSDCSSLKKLSDLSGISNLEKLNLRCCYSLKELPDLSGIPNLEELNLRYCYSLKELPDLSGIPNLEELNLSHCESLKELPDLSGIPNLKELDLSYCPFLKELPDLSGIPNLKGLNLVGCKSIKELPDLSGIPNLKGLNLSGYTSLKELPDLKKLNLSGCKSLKELPDLSGISNFFSNLEELNLRGCESLKELPDLSGIPNLKELDLRGCTSLKKLSDLNGISNLEKLNLPGCLSLKELPDLSGIPNLKELDLRGCTSLNELPDLSGIPNLKELHLHGCSSLKKLSDLSGISDLKKLNLSGCKSLKELPELSGIPNFFSNLEELNLSGCESLQEFPDLSGIPNLKELDLCGCTSLKKLSDLSGISNLEKLNVFGCESLKELPDLSRIPNLKELDLRGCTSLKKLSDLSGISNLEKLNVLGCESLKELPDLSRIPNLKELDLRGCTSLKKLSDLSGISNLEKLNLLGCLSLKELPDLSGIPNLKELDLSYCLSLKELPDLSGIPNLKGLNLVGCESIKELPDLSGIPNLKGLNLSGYTSLKKLPDLSGIPNLKELRLYGCTGLVEVPDSIRFLHNLVTLNVDHCSNLIMFPRKINLKSVETISISYCKLEEFSEVGEEMGFLRDLDLRGTCIKELHPSITRLIRLGVLNLGNSKLATFPKILVKMESLRWLSLDGSDIRELDESVENLIGLERLDLSECKNLTTLPCCIYGLQNLTDLYLCNCSNLARFPTNTKSLNVDGCSLSLPKLRSLGIRGCSLLSDCDFLMTLDCWETLERLNLSRNNFVSLPACLTKFVNLKTLVLNGCKRLRGIPELPPNVDLYISGCESLEEKFLKRTNRGAVIEAVLPSWVSSLTRKRHRSAEEPSPTPVNPPKRQRTAAGGQAPVVHFAYEMAISPVPMFPDLHSSHHSTTSIDESGMPMVDWLSWLSSANAEQKRPCNGANLDNDHQQEQQEQPIPSKQHCTEEQPSMPPFPDHFASSSASTCDMWRSPLAQIFQTSNWQANLDPLPNLQSTLANLQSTSPSTPEFQR